MKHDTTRPFASQRLAGPEEMPTYAARSAANYHFRKVHEVGGANTEAGKRHRSIAGMFKALERKAVQEGRTEWPDMYSK